MTLHLPPFPLKLLRLIWIHFFCRVHPSAGGTICLTWMNSSSRVRFRSWVGPISFMVKLISVMLLHSVYSPSSSVPLLTSTMCKILTAWGKTHCTLLYHWHTFNKRGQASECPETPLHVVTLKDLWNWVTMKDGERLSRIFSSRCKPVNNYWTQKFCIPSHPVPALPPILLLLHLITYLKCI